MTEQSKYRSIRKSPYIVYGFYFLFSLWFVGTWIFTADSLMRSFEPNDGTGFSALMDGAAIRPVAHRVLIPMIVHSILEIVPEKYQLEMTTILNTNPKMIKEMQRLNLSPDRIIEYCIALIVVFALFFGTLLILRKIILKYYNGHLFIIELFPCASVVLLPPFFGSGPHYIYDLPTLFFLICGLYLLFTQRWSIYYLLFLAGCLNKETGVFLFAAFIAVHYRSMKRNELFYHSFLHVVVGSSALLIVRWIYSGNPGTGMEFHLHANIHYMLLGYSIVSLILAALTIWAVMRGFDTVPIPLRKASVIIIPYLAVWTIGGLFYEPRAIFEVIFILNIFIVHTFFHTLGAKVQPNQIISKEIKEKQWLSKEPSAS